MLDVVVSVLKCCAQQISEHLTLAGNHFLLLPSPRDCSLLASKWSFPSLPLITALIPTSHTQVDLNFHQRDVASAEHREISFLKQLKISIWLFLWELWTGHLEKPTAGWKLAAAPQPDRIIKTGVTIISTSIALFIRVYQSTSQKQVQLPLFKAVLRRKRNNKSECFPHGKFQQLHHWFSSQIQVKDWNINVDIYIYLKKSEI